MVKAEVPFVNKSLSVNPITHKVILFDSKEKISNHLRILMSKVVKVYKFFSYF